MSIKRELARAWDNKKKVVTICKEEFGKTPKQMSDKDKSLAKGYLKDLFSRKIISKEYYQEITQALS